MGLLRITCLIITVLYGAVVFGQDKVQLINGKVLRGKLVKEYDDYFDFQYYKKGGKVKDLELTKYRMFSYTDSKGAETILYKQDTLMGNFFTQNEMKMFVLGERDAFTNYKSTSWFLSGYAIGFTAVILDTYDFRPNGGFFKYSPSIAPIAVPFVVTIGSGLFRTKVRKEYASDVSLLSSEYYIEGFQKVAKVKKIMRGSLPGSVLGLLSGYLVYSLGK